jgi:hypothetical protein
MPRLRALTSWADRKAGDEFEASDGDARLLCAADAIGGQKARIVDRAMAPTEPRIEPTTAAENQKPSESSKSEKRRYLRRDLRAQN